MATVDERQVALTESIHELPLDAAVKVKKAADSDSPMAFGVYTDQYGTYGAGECGCLMNEAMMQSGDAPCYVADFNEMAIRMRVSVAYIREVAGNYDDWVMALRVSDTAQCGRLTDSERTQLRIIVANALATHPDRFVNDNNPED